MKWCRSSLHADREADAAPDIDNAAEIAILHRRGRGEGREEQGKERGPDDRWPGSLPSSEARAIWQRLHNRATEEGKGGGASSHFRRYSNKCTA